MAGRNPKPTAVKKLEGNPGKRELNTKEPISAKEMPECPDWLLPEAKKEWERLADLMNQMGVLTKVDMAAFAAYCQSYARWKEAQEHISSKGSTFETDKGYQQQTPYLTVGKKNKNPFSFQSSARLLFSCNSIPKNYGDCSEGFYRRLIIIRFSHAVPQEKKDSELLEKFRMEAGGIFLFALEGLRRLMNNHYVFSETQVK